MPSWKVPWFSFPHQHKVPKPLQIRCNRKVPPNVASAGCFLLLLGAYARACTFASCSWKSITKAKWPRHPTTSSSCFLFPEQAPGWQDSTKCLDVVLCVMPASVHPWHLILKEVLVVQGRAANTAAGGGEEGSILSSDISTVPHPPPRNLSVRWCHQPRKSFQPVPASKTNNHSSPPSYWGRDSIREDKSVPIIMLLLRWPDPIFVIYGPRRQVLGSWGASKAREAVPCRQQQPRQVTSSSSSAWKKAYLSAGSSSRSDWLRQCRCRHHTGIPHGCWVGI